MHQRLRAMMTKEEVAQVIAYCDENKISYKQRLAELGVNPWSLYDAKRKYAPKEDGENAGGGELTKQMNRSSRYLAKWIFPVY